MKCARCSSELPAHSQFCLRCGTPVQAPLPQPGGPSNTSALAVPRPNNKPLIASVIVLLVALLALGGYMVRGALVQSHKSADGQLVQAPGNGGPGSLVQAPGMTVPGGPLQAPDANPNKPIQAPNAVVNTADIDDYLRFVKRIEEQKMSLTKQELAAALASSASQLGKQAEAATDDDKSKEYLPGVARESAGLEGEWDKLSKVFGARVPPQSCVSLRDAYYAMLGKVQSQFVQYHRALEQAQSDPTKALTALTSMQGTASAESDRAARDADDALYDICKKYGLRKEFDIKTDPSGSTGSLR